MDRKFGSANDEHQIRFAVSILPRRKRRLFRRQNRRRRRLQDDVFIGENDQRLFLPHF